MPIPEATSARELVDHYYGGKCLMSGKGEAWKDVNVSLIVQPDSLGMLNIPSISEPVLLWVMSGAAEIQDREIGGSWMTSQVKKRSFFLTAAGSPYECRWKLLTTEPFEFLLVSLGLPILQRALVEVLGVNATYAQLRDVSGFEDPTLDVLMEQLHSELVRRRASRLYVHSIAQATAIHLVRNYSVTAQRIRSGSPSLPGYRLRQITNWMAEHIADEINLDQLAAKAGLSKFHFHRLFKSATGVSPSHYHINLRMDIARRLLRETTKNVVTIALEIGYTNPSHFARLFRRETGLSPSYYRRQR